MSIVVIAAGGTGGHIQPGLATANELSRRGSEVSFVGTRRGLEGKLIPDAGYELDLVPMLPFTRTLGWRLILFPFALIRSVATAKRLIKRRDADVVVSMGGYVGLPVVLAARLARVPCVIHESGAIPGRANIWSGKICRKVALSFDAARSWFSKRCECRVTGMPLNSGIEALSLAERRDEARAHFNVSGFVVMVNGGSQGSVRLNDLVVGLAARWAGRDDVCIVAKTGKGRLREVQTRVDAVGGPGVCRLSEYFDHMDLAYAAADIAICRAGASTVAELGILGLPAILVPYPYAPMDHQAHNASVLCDAGSALMIRDETADAQHVGPIVEAWMAEPEKLAKMGVTNPDTAIANGAARLSDWIEELSK